MGSFMVKMTATNPKEESRTTPPIEVMVDTGAFMSWLPRQLLLDVGITPRVKMEFVTATGEVVERDTGYAILAAEGYETICEVVFAEAGDMSLLGVTTIEGFGVLLDHIYQCFVPRKIRLPTTVMLSKTFYGKEAPSPSTSPAPPPPSLP